MDPTYPLENIIGLILNSVYYDKKSGLVNLREDVVIYNFFGI